MARQVGHHLGFVVDPVPHHCVRLSSGAGCTHNENKAAHPRHLQQLQNLFYQREEEAMWGHYRVSRSKTSSDLLLSAQMWPWPSGTNDEHLNYMKKTVQPLSVHTAHIRSDNTMHWWHNVVRRYRLVLLNPIKAETTYLVFMHGPRGNPWLLNCSVGCTVQRCEGNRRNAV